MRYPAGTAPVSQKRVGLKRLARAAMGFASTSFGSVRRVCCRFDDPERPRRGARSDVVGLPEAIDEARDDLRKNNRAVRKGNGCARHAPSTAVVGVA